MWGMSYKSSYKFPQTDLDAKENELLAWVLKSPKGMNKSINQPSTSYLAKSEKEKKTKKMIT